MYVKVSLAFLTLITSSTFARAQNHPVIQLRGMGSQIYICAATSAGYRWNFRAPDAKLTNMEGHAAGHHFDGPTWQATDGSSVVGELMVSSPAPEPTSIPWLLLRAKSHRGNGLFASISFISRTQTQGGVSPENGCDAKHSGTETRVPYRATYTFFP